MLIEILTQRCNSQRLMIAEAYRDIYGRVWQKHFVLSLLLSLLSQLSALLSGQSLEPQACQTARWHNRLAQHCLLAINTSDGIMLSFLQQKCCLPHRELEKDRKSSFFYSPFFSIDHPKIFELNKTYFFLYVILGGSEICFSSFWSK